MELKQCDTSTETLFITLSLGAIEGDCVIIETVL